MAKSHVNNKFYIQFIVQHSCWVVNIPITKMFMFEPVQICVAFTKSLIVLCLVSSKPSSVPQMPRDRKKQSKYRCQPSFFFICFFCSGPPLRLQNFVGTPKNSRQNMCLSRQRQMQLGTAHKLKIK